MVHKWIFKAGTRCRSPEIIQRYRFLKESENWSLDKLEKYQLKKLKHIVNIACEKSEFYKRRFEEVGILPNDINTLQDLKKIPVLEKRDLLLEYNNIQNKGQYRKLFYSETSGSTGEPLSFYRNSEWDAGHRAAQYRGYSWYDTYPWDINGYLWGYSFDFKKKVKTMIGDQLMNRFRLFSYEEKDIIQYCNKLKKADYLEGYSSMIYEIAKVINQYSLGPFNLKMVKGTSEKIFDTYQDEARKAFGKKIISEYGAAETGIIAFECPRGNMHITMENVIVEEEDGEAIITNLISDSFPIIRYKLGDSIILDNNTICPCGMNHKIIKDVIGRVGKVIYGFLSKYPSLTLYYIFKNLTLQHNIKINYQAVQREKGKLEIYLEKGIKSQHMENLKNECKVYFKNDLVVSIFPNKLKRDYSKKFRDFISEID